MTTDKIAIADVESSARLKRGDIIKSKNGNFYVVVNFDDHEYEVMIVEQATKRPEGMLKR